MLAERFTSAEKVLVDSPATPRPAPHGGVFGGLERRQAPFAMVKYPGRALLLSGEADTKFTSVAARRQSAFPYAEHCSVASLGYQLLVKKSRVVAPAAAVFLNQRE